MSISVVPISRGWGIEIDRNSQSATKAFITATSLPNETPQALPAMDEAYSANYPHLKVVSYDISFLGDNEICGMEYIVNYSTNNFVDTNGPTQTSDFIVPPITMNISGQAELVKITHEGEDHQLTVYNAIKREAVTEMVLHREIYTNDITGWIDLCQSRVGTINTSDFNGIPQGCCMFEGAEMQNGTDRYTQRKWIGDFHFKVLLLQGVENDSWQHQFRVTENEWQKPAFVKVPYEAFELYEKTDFNSFLTKDIKPLGFDPSLGVVT
jgi:hypothetical protein